MSVRFEMRVDDELMARIDGARGSLVPRAAWVRQAIEAMLDGDVTVPKAPQKPPKAPPAAVTPTTSKEVRALQNIAEATMMKASDVPTPPLWRCSKCGWEKRAHSVRSCPDHGYEHVAEVF